MRRASRGKGSKPPFHLPGELRGALLFAAALLAASCGKGSERPPSVILIAIDTLRADHTSLYGYDRKTTPELERWAEGGTVFERAWAASSWTLPSVAMLLTGRARSDNSGAIRPAELPLAELLAGHGYRTAAVVANPLLNATQGYQRGFERFDVRAENSPEWDADEVVDRGIALLDLHQERPFFLYLHLFDPHYPYLPAQGLVQPARDDPARRAAFAAALPDDKKALLDDEAYRGIETLIALYDSEIARADRALGRLFAHLEQTGLAERTLVAVTSDHGEGLWQRAPAVGEELKTQVFFPHLYYSHGVQLYSEQVRVPLVLRGPDVPAGKVRADDATLLDVVPTLLDLAGLAPPEGLAGVSLAEPGAGAGRAIYSVCSRVASVTVGGRWRLHVPRENRVLEHQARPELFDLEQDPLELTPLADAERTGELVRLVAQWRASHAGLPRDAIDAEQRALLEALGYTGEADR